MITSVIQVRNELIQYWEDNYNSSPTLYPNSPLPDALKANPFIMFELEFIKSTTVGTGTTEGTFTRHRGLMYITVNTPYGTGNKTAYTLADETITLLERKRIAGSISTYAGYIDTSGKSYDGEHFQVVVAVPFTTTVG